MDLLLICALSIDTYIVIQWWYKSHKLRYQMVKSWWVFTHYDMCRCEDFHYNELNSLFLGSLINLNTSLGKMLVNSRSFLIWVFWIRIFWTNSSDNPLIKYLCSIDVCMYVVFMILFIVVFVELNYFLFVNITFSFHTLKILFEYLFLQV